MDNIAMGVAIGVALGAALGGAVGAFTNKGPPDAPTH
jgi:hypothetical protein